MLLDLCQIISMFFFVFLKKKSSKCAIKSSSKRIPCCGNATHFKSPYNLDIVTSKYRSYNRLLLLVGNLKKNEILSKLTVGVIVIHA